MWCGVAQISFALHVVSCLQRSVEISTRLTGMARWVGMRVQPKFFSAELHTRAYPDSIPHKRGSRLPLPRCPLWSSRSQQPQQSGSVAPPPGTEPDHNQFWIVSFLADKGVKPRKEAPAVAKKGERSLGVVAPGRQNNFITSFFEIAVNNSPVS